VFVKIRELLTAVPSTSASLSVILQSLVCAFSPHKAGLTGNPAMTRTRTGVFASLDVGRASGLPTPILPAGFADLVNERLIGGSIGLNSPRQLGGAGGVHSPKNDRRERRSSGHERAPREPWPGAILGFGTL